MTNKDRGVYSPPPDEYDRFDVGDEDDSRRGPLLLVVAVAVLIALAAVVYTAYNQGVRSGGRGEAPLIAADPAPIKTKPDNPGGKPDTGSQSAAYDPLDGPETTPDVTIAPPSEQPAPRPETRQPKPKPVPKPAVQQPKPKPVVTPPPRPSRAFAVKRDGNFLVQLGAYRSQDQAQSTWDALHRRLPVILDGTAADIERADLGAKGVYYRLRASAFADRANANAFCASLKSKGQDCIVVAR
jgi:cell division protein FtsN